MVEKIDLASVSYTLGILSIVFAFVSFWGVGGLIIGVIGFILAKKEGAVKAKKLNKIGIIISVVVLIINFLVVRFLIKSGAIGPGIFPMS